MARKSPFVPLLLILLFLLMVHEALPCGMVTHGEISQRALWSFVSEQYPVYQQYLARHQDALQAGATFPDWGYQFGYGDESEAAHWDPFIEASAAYIHATYPKPWDEETEKLAVFLLGIMSHSTADIYWHSLGVSQGFLDVMGKQDFHGSFDDAHSHGDFGGDVLCSYERDLSWMVNTWYVPVVDMARVYNNLGFDRVTPDILTKYNFLLFLAAHIERPDAKLLFPLYAAPSPFLVEQFEDYFIGGLDDMAIRTSWRWQDVIDWMENGVPEPMVEIDGLPAPDDWTPGQGPASSLSLLSPADLNVLIEKTERGVIFRSHSLPADQPAAGQEPLDPMGKDRSISYEMSTPYAHLGTSLAKGDFNHDGLDDLAMGAPGYGTPGHPQRGAVYIMYGRQEISGHEHIELSQESADLTLIGSEDYGRFGWSLAAVDLDADGVEDLAVGAPTTGSRSLAYQGKVFVYFGSTQGSGLSPEPDMVIAAEEDYTNLGWSLAAGDLDGDGHNDLLVGSPFAKAGGEQRGLAAVFLSSHVRAHGIRSALDDADWITFGEHDYDWFGYHIGFAALNDKGRLILVGAPTTKGDGLQGTGTLYGFDMSGVSQKTVAALPLFSITGISEFDKTGSSFACGDPLGTGEPLLALSSPTQRVANETQAGSVVLVPLNTLQGQMKLDSIHPVTSFLGDQRFARLGWQTGFADFNNDARDDLWLTEPWRTTDAGVEAGAAYLWLGGNSFPTGSVASSAESAFWNIDQSAPQSLFGSAVAFPDFNGDGSADVAIGAPRASSLARSSGAVYVIITPAPTPHTLSPSGAGQGTSQTYTISGERLFSEGLSITLMQGDYRIVPSHVTVLNQDTIQCDVSIPKDAPLGEYGLNVRTVFGNATLNSALNVTPAVSEQAAGGTEAGCGCAHFGSTTRPSIMQLLIVGLIYLLPFGYILIRLRVTVQSRVDFPRRLVAGGLELLGVSEPTLE